LPGVGTGASVEMTHILVVEDENWLAMELAWLVQEAGYAVLGPERSVAEARTALGRVKVDLALLDIRLGGETVFPLSKMLEAMGVPFIFLTANPDLLPAEYRERPTVTKPWQATTLLSLIPQVLGAARDSAGWDVPVKEAPVTKRFPSLGAATRST
jgi:DNA-binding NtrC family response regulator